jgi:hypothetical protein
MLGNVRLGLVMFGVATIGVDFATSCPVAHRGSPVLNMASSDVTTHGVRSPNSCLMACGGSSV